MSLRNLFVRRKSSVPPERVHFRSDHEPDTKALERVLTSLELHEPRNSDKPLEKRCV